jgi:hypothetical protein
MWVGNNGDGSNNPITGGQGLIWPKGSGKGAIFEDGPVIGGKINNLVYLSGSKYRHGLQAGKIINGLPDDTKNPKYRIYKIQKNWSTSIDAKRLKDNYDNWPGDDGAPYIDKNSNGKWDKGIDEPKFISDQQLWFVMNDMDSNKTKNFSGTKPMGLEIQCLVFGYDIQGALGNVVFKKFIIINKGENDIDSMYLSYWSDPDLGSGIDDRSGCDTTLNLAFCYNGGQVDAVYGVACPAVGYDIIQGPIVAGLYSDLANWNFGKRKGYRNLGMTSFHPISCGGPQELGDCPQGDYSGAVMWFNIMKSATLDNSILINPVTNLPTKFIFDGDPVTGTGWLDGDGKPSWNTIGCGDRYHIQSSGPFIMMKGDTQEVIIAIVVGQGSDRLSSITSMKSNTLSVKWLFENGLLINQQNLTFTAAKNGELPSAQSLIIKYNLGKISGWNMSDKPTWLDVSKSNGSGEDTIQVSINTTNLNEGIYSGKILISFSGSTIGQQEVEVKLIIEPNPPKINLSTKTLIFNAVKNTFKPASKKVYINNSGGSSLDWGAYSNSSWLDIIPGSGKESDSISVKVTTTDFPPGEYDAEIYINAIAINNPEVINVKYIIDPLIFGDTIKVEKTGKNEASFYPIVLDKSKLNGHSYEISFDTINNNTHEVVLWKVIDLTTGELKTINYNFSGYGEYPLIDGVYLKVVGPTKTGLRSDDDPILRGWIWEPGPPDGNNRFIKSNSYGDLGLDCFGPTSGGLYNSIGYPHNWYGVISLQGYQCKKVEIRFSSDPLKQQKGYRYLSGASSAIADSAYIPFIKNKVGGYPYQDYVNMPFTVWDVEENPPVQLVCGFLEYNKAKPDGNVDGKWRPTASSTGGREYFFIFSSPYTINPDAKYMVDMSSAKLDIMYQGIVVERSTDYPFPNDPVANVEAKLTLIPYHPITKYDKFKFTSSSLASVNDKKDITEVLQYKLYQNYPNPFNPSTIIKYDIPENAFVTIKIYSSIGQEIETLVNQKQDKGRYEINWKPKNLSSGIYFYKFVVSGSNPLRTERYNEYRKMLYIK